jgi:hypothetical protein
VFLCALTFEGYFERVLKGQNIMQAGQLTIANSNVNHIHASSFTGKVGDLMARMFGCWHGDLSRPFSRGGRAYRTCLNCGAQRQFNLGSWEMQGRFFYQN